MKQGPRVAQITLESGAQREWLAQKTDPSFSETGQVMGRTRDHVQGMAAEALYDGRKDDAFVETCVG